MKETLGSSAPVGPLDGAWPVCGHLWWETWHEVRLNIRLKKKWEQGPCVVNKFNVSLEKKKVSKAADEKPESTQNKAPRSQSFLIIKGEPEHSRTHPHPCLHREGPLLHPPPLHTCTKGNSHALNGGDLLPLGRLTADSHFIQVFWGPFVQKE